MLLGSSIATAATAVAVLVGSVAGSVVGTTGNRAGQLAGAPAAPGQGDRSTMWSWPLRPDPVVVNRFDPPDQPWLPGHRGVDLGAEVGQEVLTPTDGQVAYSGMLAGRGVVVIAHPGGLRSTLEPVVDGPPVGTVVARGTSVGHIGATATHCQPSVCLHWGVVRGRTYLDPLTFITRPPIVLLPLR